MKLALWVRWSALASAVVLAGCATDHSGGTDALVKVHIDNQQRVTTIDFPPQPADCDRRSHCPTIGAMWSSQAPNRAVLLIGTLGGQTKVESVQFDVRPFAPVTVRSLATPASDLPGVTAFLVPMDTVERIALGKNTYIKLNTDAKTIEEPLIEAQRSSAAAAALKRLVYEAYKGTDKEMSKGLLDLFADDNYAPNYDK